MSASLNCKQINKDIFYSIVNHLDLADKFMYKWYMHHMMWRIMQISEAVITFTVIYIILHNILSLIQ